MGLMGPPILSQSLKFWECNSNLVQRARSSPSDSTVGERLSEHTHTTGVHAFCEQQYIENMRQRRSGSRNDEVLWQPRNGTKNQCTGTRQRRTSPIVLVVKLA